VTGKENITIPTSSLSPTMGKGVQGSDRWCQSKKGYSLRDEYDM
jgi:hypothetical protein